MSYKDPIKQRDYQRKWQRKRTIQNRKKALEILGNKCAECGNNDPRVLEIDHLKLVRRDAVAVNRSVDAGARLAQKIVLGAVTKDDVQLLCANCHKIKTYQDRIKFNNYIK